jgi:hypothetical protein
MVPLLDQLWSEVKNGSNLALKLKKKKRRDLDYAFVKKRFNSDISEI